VFQTSDRCSQSVLLQLSRPSLQIHNIKETLVASGGMLNGRFETMGLCFGLPLRRRSALSKMASLAISYVSVYHDSVCLPDSLWFIQRPKGFFESLFMIQVVAALLKCTKGSLGTYGKPLAAMAMAAVAVSSKSNDRRSLLTRPQLERAFMTFATGEHVKNTVKFSKEEISDIYNDYLFTMKEFTERTWDRIEKACAVENKSRPGDHQVEAAITLYSTKQRRTLFIPSSPAKGYPAGNAETP